MRVILAGRYLVHDSTTARWWIQIVVAEFLFRRIRLVDQLSFFRRGTDPLLIDVRTLWMGLARSELCQARSQRRL